MASRTLTYTNPVYAEYFADPFVLRVKKGDEFTYYAYGTGPPDRDSRHFPILRSSDLTHWEYVGHALDPIPGGTTYWAPETAQKDGRFYLYYSASTSESDEHHRLRVAVASDPAGPFQDIGRELLPAAGFSIDAHPFRDPRTNRWYLYFATDFTEDDPTGTGLAVVPLADDLITPLDTPRPIVRATCTWQIYERNRDYKGKLWEAWNCVEGPFVLFHDERYYCLYSGGAWHTENYGLGFAVADDPVGPFQDEMAHHGPTVLKGLPGRVIGPGHNSVILGPDGKTEFVVYHAWDPDRTARRMCIDPLTWTPAGPKCDGPSTGQKTITL